MSDALLTLLQWCLLALIYLFFFRVLQATWYGSVAPVRPKPTATARSRRGVLRRSATAPTVDAAAPVVAGPVAVSALVVIAPPEDAGTTFPLASITDIGRSGTCSITLDDTYVSQMHARLSLTHDGVILEDLGSTNGTYHNRQRLTAAATVRAGDLIQIGGTIMELR